MYNRFYLDPHITPELAGTRLNYNFRGKRLTISLDSGRYSVSDKQFKITANASFGFNTVKDQLCYFNGNSSAVSLQVKSTTSLTIDIQNWNSDKLAWIQNSGKSTPQLLNYLVYQLKLKPNTYYSFFVGSKLVKRLKSNLDGELVIGYHPKAVIEQISIRNETTL